MNCIEFTAYDKLAMEADDDWVVLSDGGGGSDSASDDGSDDCGFVLVRKAGGDRWLSVVVSDAPTVAVAAAAAVPQPTLQQGPFAVISYREAFSAPSPGDGGSGCERSDLFFDDTTIREALFGAGCCGQGAGIGKEDCESEVGEHGVAGSSSVVKAPSTPSAAAAYSPLSELPSGMEEEEDVRSSGEEVDEEEAETPGEEVEDEMDAGTSGEEEEEDEDLGHSSEQDDDDDTESFGEEEEDDDYDACTESEEDGYDDDDGCTESCSEEEDDGTDSFCEKEEEDDTESSGEEAVMEEKSSSHIADCGHHQDKLQAGNEEPPAFPVDKYDDIDDSESDDESKYGYIDIIPSPPRRADDTICSYCKTACIACGGFHLGAAIEVEKELLDFCPCKYDGIGTGSSGMGEGSLESSDEQRRSAENVELSELVCKILELLGSDEEDEETSSSDMEESDSDEDDGVDSSDVDESSDEEPEEPVGISYDGIDSSEEEEDDDGEEEKEEEDEVEGEEEDEEEHGFDVVDNDVAGLDVPPGQRCPGSPTADLTFLVVVYLLVYLAFSYMVMLLQELA